MIFHLGFDEWCPHDEVIFIQDERSHRLFSKKDKIPQVGYENCGGIKSRIILKERVLLSPLSTQTLTQRFRNPYKNTEAGN